MPMETVNPMLTESATSVHSISVGSASSLLVSSDLEPVDKEKLASIVSLKNGFIGSWATLAPVTHCNECIESSHTRTSFSESIKSSSENKDYLPIVSKAERHSSRLSTTGKDGEYSRFGDKKDEQHEGLSAKQWLLLSVLSLATLTSSFAICLFPPFFPKLAEEKGTTASIYGFIIGTNCLASFLVTPFIGKNLKVIGVRFAFVSGVFIGGVCCILSGFLEWFPPGLAFIAISIAIRVVHAAGNAGTITSTFTYSAVEFPNSVAKIFSLTRTMMNIAQLAGPIIGGAMCEVGGFKMPFILMGAIQTVMAFVSYPFLPDYDASEYDKGSQKTSSTLAILCVPSIWIPFFTFIVSTMSNGFLSINLERQVFQKFGLTQFYVGLFFGLKDGANSIASPFWGFLCDRLKSVKPLLLLSTVVGALSIFLLGPFPYVPIDRNLTVVGVALALSGISFAGQQVCGVVDAMREAVHAGYPDNPSTHGMVAGIWSSLSGAGRFVSRAGTGILVDHIGFQMTAAIVFGVQALVAVATLCCNLSKFVKPSDKEGEKTPHCSRKESFTYSVDMGDFPRVTITQPESPAECLMCKSVSIPLPRNCAIIRRLRAETYAGFPR